MSDHPNVPEVGGSWPEPIEFIREIRRTVGLFDGAMPITPKQAWDEAIEQVRLLTTGRCHACLEKPIESDERNADADPPV